MDEIKKRLDDVHETALLGVGLATMANHKLDQMKERAEDHELRITTQEETDPIA